MASMTMTASFLGSATSTVTRNSSGGGHRDLVVASRASEGEKTSLEFKQNGKEESSSRRDLVFAAAAATAFSVAKLAIAAEEPKAGTPEAKKKYAPVCVTMPTARICRKWEGVLFFYFFFLIIVYGWSKGNM